MEKWGEDLDLAGDNTLKANRQTEEKKEEKFINLIMEVIVQATLKQYYEKGD